MTTVTKIADFTDSSNSNLKLLHQDYTHGNLGSTTSLSTSFVQLYNPGATQSTNLSGVKKINYMYLTNSDSLGAGQGIKIRLKIDGTVFVIFDGTIDINSRIDIITPQAPIYLNGKDMTIEHFKGTGSARLIWQFEDLRS